MPELTVTLDDGTSAAPDQCDWVFFDPCGCPRGVMDAVVLGEVLWHDEAAFRAFFDDGLRKRSTDARIKRERKRGVTAVMMTHDRYRAEISPVMLRKCPHVAARGGEGDE